jgi:hypothetical protein
LTVGWSDLLGKRLALTIGLTFREKHKQHATVLGLRHMGRAGRVVNEGSCGIAVLSVAERAGDYEYFFGAGRVNV